MIQLGGRNQFSLSGIDVELTRHGALWYQNVNNDVNESKASMDWLQIQKKHLQTRKDALKKPRGMISGLIIFALFSIIGIVVPLFLTPFYTDSYNTYLFYKCLLIGTFTGGLGVVFIYMANLLKWK